MKNIDTIIFDMDGVIFDTERVYLDIWISVFERHGYKMTKELYTSVMGTGRKNVINTYLKTYGEDLPINKLYEEKDIELFRIIDEEGIPLKDGAYELLSYLKDKGYKIALGTSATKERLEKQLKDKEMLEKFDVLVCGDDVEKGKPNPDIFIKACEKVKSCPENCVVIEDSLAGIKAAYNAKMNSIHVEDLIPADEEIMKYSYANFKSLKEVKSFLEF